MNYVRLLKRYKINDEENSRIYSWATVNILADFIFWISFSFFSPLVQMKTVNYTPVPSRSERNSCQMHLENKYFRNSEKFADNIYENTVDIYIL